MEKYIIVLIILAMMFFVFCTFPILAKEPTNAYILTRSSYIADKKLSNCEKWQTASYFVYKIPVNDVQNIIPDGKIIYEYYLTDNNNILSNTPYMKIQHTNSCILCGVPYIID